MSAYLGFDVLDVVEHNRSEPLDELLRRRFALLGGQTGIIKTHSPVKAADPSRPFHWTAFSRAEVADMRAFLDARKGIVVPFWLPSYQSNLVLLEDVDAAATVITIRRTMYTRLLFPGSGARRHIALHRRGEGFVAKFRIVDADDPGPGSPETITVDPPAPADIPAKDTTVMFLALSRLEDHITPINWLNIGTGIADAIIRTHEVPNEAPT